MPPQQPMSEQLGLPPYVAPQLPEITPPPVPTAAVSPGFESRGPTTLAGGLAGIGDQFLRGWMRGKATAEAKKAIQIKRQADNAQAAYEMADRHIRDLHASGVPHDSDEYKQAEAAVNGAYQGWLAVYGQHLAPEDTGQKKSKGQKIKGGLAEMFASQDPVQVSRAWYQLMRQLPPPVLAQLRSEDTKAIQQRRELGEARGAVELQKTKDEARQLELAAKARTGALKDPAEIKEYESLQEAGETPQQTSQRIASQIVLKHVENGEPYSQQEAQSLTALTGHNITPKSVTMKNKNGEVAIGTPNEDGTWTWEKQQVFTPTPAGSGRGGGRHPQDHPGLSPQMRVKLQATEDRKNKAFEQARQAFRLPANDPYRISRDEYIARLQAAQSAYEKSGETLLGHPVPHFDVREHIDEEGNWINTQQDRSRTYRAYQNGKPVDATEYTEEQVQQIKQDPETSKLGIEFR